MEVHHKEIQGLHSTQKKKDQFALYRKVADFNLLFRKDLCFKILKPTNIKLFSQSHIVVVEGCYYSYLVLNIQTEHTDHHTFRVKANCVNKAAVTLKLLQQLPIHIINVKSPHPYKTVVAPRHHQVLSGGVVLSTVHKGWMREHLLGCSQEPVHIPLSEGKEQDQEELTVRNIILYKNWVYLFNITIFKWHYWPRQQLVAKATAQNMLCHWCSNIVSASHKKNTFSP